MYSYKREKEGDKARKVRATNRLDEDSWKLITNCSGSKTLGFQASRGLKIRESDTGDVYVENLSEKSVSCEETNR